MQDNKKQENKVELTIQEKKALSINNQFMTKYQNKLANYFNGNKEKTLKFLSAMSMDMERNPDIALSDPKSVIDAYLNMAFLGFMPSQISGECYVVAYNNKYKDEKGEWKAKKVAQLQVGYQGWVTLFYKAGIQKITSDIIREKDIFSYSNGELKHEIDLTLSAEERGKPIGAYVRIMYKDQESVRYMNGKDILAHAQKFSKSFDPNGKYSPWNSANDPELNMWRKTVLKQFQKFLPKNETINLAMHIDNQESTLAERLPNAIEQSKSLLMGNFIKSPNETNKKTKENQDETQGPESDQGHLDE